VIIPSQGRYLHRTTHRQKQGKPPYLEWMISVFEKAKTFHDVERTATVIRMNSGVIVMKIIEIFSCSTK
jgi:hypothetical protein